MKRMVWLIALNLTLFSARAQTDNVIKITGTRFPFDIMQQWIQEYSKTQAGVRFELSKNIPADSADLQIAAHGFREEEVTENQEIITVNRYVQLPIVNSHREDLKALQQKGFTKKNLHDIYFSEEKKDGFSHSVTVYKRDKNVCASRSFAENVTGIQSDITGTLVTGDDKALSAAVKKDIGGISYNNLSFIYNLQTRKIIDSLAIVPIDVNENGKVDANENIYSTIDDVLAYVSKNSNTSIPQDNVNIVLNRSRTNPEALRFVNWILTKGQSYNSHFGFLSLMPEVVARGQQTISALQKQTAQAK